MLSRDSEIICIFTIIYPLNLVLWYNCKYNHDYILIYGLVLRLSTRIFLDNHGNIEPYPANTKRGNHEDCTLLTWETRENDVNPTYHVCYTAHIFLYVLNKYFLLYMYLYKKSLKYLVFKNSFSFLVLLS